MAFFVAAGIAVVLAMTSGWWVPALPTLLGIVEANSNLIGALADLAQIVTFVILALGAVLACLGYKNLRSANAGEGAQQAVVVGDHNRVEVFGDITYDYGDVAPSPVDASTLERARQRLEETRMIVKHVLKVLERDDLVEALEVSGGEMWVFSASVRLRRALSG